MKHARRIGFAVAVSALIIIGGAAVVFAEGSNSYGPAVDSFCLASTGQTPFADNGCSLCHSSIPSRNSQGQEWEATAGSASQRDASVFCPAPTPPPACNDGDGDGYGSPGDPSCSNGPATDCNDADPAVHPGAVENCTDTIDNNCNGFVDAQDANAVGCPLNCVDNDLDGFAVDGGPCGQIDCDDTNLDVNPGMAELCDNGVDDNCNNAIDEGCNAACPDADGDGFADDSCGGADCDDADPDINPGMAEICGDGIDANCNGMSDETCPACPEGSTLTIKKADYDLRKGELEAKGRTAPGTRVSVYDAATGDLIADDVNVKHSGKWKMEVDGFTDTTAPETIEVTNSDGCSTTAAVRVKNRDHDDEGDDEGIGDDYEDYESENGDGDDDDDEEDEEEGQQEYRRSWWRYQGEKHE